MMAGQDLGTASSFTSVFLEGPILQSTVGLTVNLRHWLVTKWLNKGELKPCKNNS